MQVVQPPCLPLIGFQELHHTAISYADKMMLTDAPLLYTPGQVNLN